MGIGEVMYEPWYQEMQQNIKKHKNKHQCGICKYECVKCGKESKIPDVLAEYFKKLEERIDKLEKTISLLVD